MNCKGVIREISSYIDGEMDPALKQEIASHLQDCRECALVVSQTKLTVEIFCDSEPVELPQDVRSRLHKALQRKMRRPSA